MENFSCGFQDFVNPSFLILHSPSTEDPLYIHLSLINVPVEDIINGVKGDSGVQVSNCK